MVLGGFTIVVPEYFGEIPAEPWHKHQARQENNYQFKQSYYYKLLDSASSYPGSGLI